MRSSRGRAARGGYRPRACVRRLLLHAARSRVLHLPRRQDRRRGVRAAADRADATGFSASPWAYNGMIFAMSEDGDTYVIKAGPEFKVLGRIPSTR